jgi:hypothetical protein
MRARTLLVVGFALMMAVPSVAMASHMSQYLLFPVAHDLLGSVHEPDGQSTSVLGPTVSNCVVDLPLGGSFTGRCGDDALKTGLGEFIAPGCTGDDGEGGTVARQSGQCGLWVVGVRPQSVPVVPPGTVPAPASEQGLGAGQFPGRYSGTVRFLDASIDQESTQNPGPAPGTSMTALNRFLDEAGIGNWILPGDAMIWAWLGDWTDLNGNGVVDACFATCTLGWLSGSQQNEFVWLGNCLAFNGVPNALFATQNGFCKEDPNPNVAGSHACAPLGSDGPCANAGMAFWLFPGNHNPGVTSDSPGAQAVDFVLRLGDCTTAPTCDDDSTSCEDNTCFGDSFLDVQDYVTPDGLGMDDRSGDNAVGNVGDDTARNWAGNLGNVGTYYGDDGFLQTEVVVYGYNCALGTLNGFDLGTAPGTDGGCTFLDVDKYPTMNGDLEALLAGGEDYPNGGLKGQLRGAWEFVAYGQPLLPTNEMLRLADSVVNSQDVYLATQGPLQGSLDDQYLNPGFSREPNVGAATYKDASGATQTVRESYLGTVHGDCVNLSLNDTRANSTEAAHRGYCNRGPGGLGTAYSAWSGTVGRGWLDVTPVRHAFVGTPITISPPCLYCVFGAPFVGIGLASEQPEGFAAADPSEHSRALGPGLYLFTAARGTWQDKPFVNDESLYPDLAGTTLVTYPPDHWVNSLQRTTGQVHYRNFLPLTCTTEKDAINLSSVHEAAECNPYLDGAIQNPQDYTVGVEAGGEFDGTPQASGCAGTRFALAPADGVMDTQIVVIRDYNQGIGPLLPNIGGGLPPIETYGPGAVDPLLSDYACADGGWLTGEELVWAQGNLGDDIVTWVTQDVPLGVDLDEDGNPDSDTITDVDVYAGWAI